MTPSPLRSGEAVIAATSAWIVVVGGPQVELLGRLLVLVDRAPVGAGQGTGVDHDAVEHGLQIEGGADRPPDFGERGQPLQRLGEVAGALGHLAFEARVRFLEPARRPVELVAERLQLVAGPDLDAMGEVAGPDARRALLQHPDGRDHAPGQENAGQDRQPQAEHEDDHAPDDRRAERRVGGGGRSLDEDQPPHGRDRRVRREDALAPQTIGDHRRRRGRAGVRALGPSGFHLHERGEIALRPEHPAVRMGDQLVTGVHHIGVAVRADLDLRHDFQDGPEIDLRGGHLDRVLADGQGQGDVRLGAVLEVHRTPVRLSRPGLEELGRPREIFLTAHDVRVQARDPQLLLAGEVEVGELADGRDVAQDPQEVELPLLGQGGAQAFAKSQPRPAPPDWRRDRRTPGGSSRAPAARSP